MYAMSIMSCLASDVEVVGPRTGGPPADRRQSKQYEKQSTVLGNNMRQSRSSLVDEGFDSIHLLAEGFPEGLASR